MTCNLKPRKVKKMTKENRELYEELQALREENQSLKIDNDFLQRQNRACKMRCSKYSIQIRELESEIADLRFTHKFLTSEDAGKAFAQELLPPDTTFIKAEEAAEQLENEVVGAMGSFLGDDF